MKEKVLDIKFVSHHIRYISVAFLIAIVFVTVINLVFAEDSDKETVTIAAKDIEIGAILSEGDLKTVKVNKSLIPESAQNADSVVGKKTVVKVSKSEIITLNQLTDSIFESVPAGKVIVEVPIKNLGATVLFVAGTKIDLLAEDKESKQPKYLAKNATVLPNVTNRESSAESVKKLTLAVDAKEAENIALAGDKGVYPVIVS
jgi:Flp pilus assembly protein CpaB